MKDRLADATTELQKAIQLDPAQADIHYTLGVTLWQQGDFAKAVNELRAAIQAKPDYAEAHYTLGTVLKQQGKLHDAANALREAIRLQPNFAGAHTTLAAVLRQLGDAAGAAAESRAGEQIGREKNSARGEVEPKFELDSRGRFQSATMFIQIGWPSTPNPNHQ